MSDCAFREGQSVSRPKKSDKNSGKKGRKGNKSVGFFSCPCRVTRLATHLCEFSFSANMYSQEKVEKLKPQRN